MPFSDIFKKKTDTTKDIKDIVFKEDQVNFVKKKFQEYQDSRKAFELQWMLNVNFLNGNQYCDLDMHTQSITDIKKLYYYQQQEVFNQIAPIIETRLAKLGRVDPSLKTRPASSSREDISTAKICTSILKGTYSKHKMHKKIKYANSWSEVTGTVLHKTVWNTEKGRSIGMLEEDGNSQDIKEGDIDQIIVNSFECYPDSPFSEDIQFCRGFIHARPMSVDEIYDMHGVEIDGKELDVWNVSQTYGSSGGLGYGSNLQKVTSMKKKNQALLIEYYEVPSRKHPDGQLIIIAGDKLVYSGELPYLIGEDKKRGIPFVRQVCIERPGHFWGVSVIERLLPVQRAYNAVKNRKHEYLNRCVLQVLTYEEGAIDEEMIEEEGIAPGSHIPYKVGHPAPQFMQNGSLPSEFNNEEARLENLFTTISGVSTFSRDSAPPVGANSGIAMEIVREQDDTRLSLTAENIRLSIIAVGQIWLRLYKQYAKVPRILRFIDEENEVMTMDWGASDITSDDVVIESENELTQTPAQRRQLVFDLMQAGLFADPDTGRISRSARAKILEMVELGNWESSNSLDQDHINRANRENMLLEKEQPPEIFEYDDDLIHMDEHLKYILSEEFEAISESNPQMMQVLLIHMKEHEQGFQTKNAPPPQEVPQQVVA